MSDSPELAALKSKMTSEELVELESLRNSFKSVAETSGYVPCVQDENGKVLWEGEMIPFSEPDAYNKCQEITDKKIAELSKELGEPIADQPKLSEEEFIEKLKTSGTIKL